ncbi:hypothetical protein BLA60_19945 [Actinophytocola xinjiangensis]|uniref:DUF4097 domain-containing protein n=1 Tax=Actinophytocola xinjiangensis TaxID=485602 RepID=A0A7Z1AYE2_9PSEU|nr:hypothetical protein BLA60_19945 [Actinophytocola xinjiangensis]
MGRAVAAGAIVVAGLGVFTACGWDITKERATDNAGITEEFSRVRFLNDSGNLTINTGGDPEVTRTIFYEDDKPGPTHRVENGTLVLEPCPQRDCHIDYEVVVPEGTVVEGEVNSGNVDITGVAEVDLKADSGDIDVRRVDGTVNVDASSGNVDLIDIGGATQVEADSGNVTISLAVIDDVRARVNSGNVEVTVPDGRYQVSTDIDSGDLDSALDNDEGGEHHLDLAVDSGNITVKKS